MVLSTNCDEAQDIDPADWRGAFDEKTCRSTDPLPCEDGEGAAMPGAP